MRGKKGEMKGGKEGVRREVAHRWGERREKERKVTEGRG